MAQTLISWSTCLETNTSICMELSERINPTIPSEEWPSCSRLKSFIFSFWTDGEFYYYYPEKAAGPLKNELGNPNSPEGSQVLSKYQDLRDPPKYFLTDSMVRNTYQGPDRQGMNTLCLTLIQRSRDNSQGGTSSPCLCCGRTGDWMCIPTLNICIHCKLQPKYGENRATCLSLTDCH